jgi:hypothetical protein
MDQHTHQRNPSSRNVSLSSSMNPTATCSKYHETVRSPVQVSPLKRGVAIVQLTNCGTWTRTALFGAKSATWPFMLKKPEIRYAPPLTVATYDRNGSCEATKSSTRCSQMTALDSRRVSWWFLTMPTSLPASTKGNHISIGVSSTFNSRTHKDAEHSQLTCNQYSFRTTGLLDFQLVYVNITAVQTWIMIVMFNSASEMQGLHNGDV